MKDFFTFYKNIKELQHPFLAFSLAHLVLLGIMIAMIVMLYRRYSRLIEERQRVFKKGMGIYFLVEEFIYTSWLFMNCHEHVWLQVLPLELCSICAYVNAYSVFSNKEGLRFFSGVVGLVAGFVAIVYPANISGLYPVISYRVINFYLLHGSFILFALLQIKDKALLKYVYLKQNTVAICFLFTFAYVVNLLLKSQYMLVGAPPSISFLARIFDFFGVVLFLPIMLMIFVSLQFVILFLLRKLYRCPSEKHEWKPI